MLMRTDSNQCCVRGIDETQYIVEGMVQPLTHAWSYSPGVYPQALPYPLYPPALQAGVYNWATLTIKPFFG